jgi:hypothetical protein
MRMRFEIATLTTRLAVLLALAQGSAPAQESPGPRGRPFVSVIAAVPVVTYVGPAGHRKSQFLSPADRFATSQLIGIGYVINPQLRVGVMGVFNEVLSGLPPGADAWQVGAVAPVVIRTFRRAMVGGGPLLAYRSGGRSQSDVGCVIVSGASLPLRQGLALNVLAPVTGLFDRRTTVSLSVAVGLTKIF